MNFKTAEVAMELGTVTAGFVGIATTRALLAGLGRWNFMDRYTVVVCK